MANMIYRGAAAPAAVTATALNKNAALTNDQIDQNFYSLNIRKVEIDDSRLSDSRPASDVYAWAKAATAPTNTSGAYTFSAITDSTSSSTGAVILSGGLGVAKNLYAGGAISAVGNITSTSDARVKINLEKIPNALGKVNQLNGYTFDRIDVETPRQTGVIAQEVLKVLPEAVSGNEDAYSVAYGNMIGLMIEAIKELNAKVVDLQNQLAINK